MLIKAIDYKKLSDSTLDPTTIDLAYVEGTLKQSIANYDSLTVTVDGNNKVNVSITGKNKWEGLIAQGSYSTMEVSEDNSYYVYNEGQYEDLWEQGAAYVSDGTVTLTKEANDLLLSVVNNEFDGAVIIVSTTSKIDLTSYTKLRFDIDVAQLSSIYIGSLQTNNFNSSPLFGGVPDSDANGYYWDISSYNGEYYLLCELGLDTPGSTSGKIYKVWLE
ncbi:MAG: hypothetical protein PHQ89_00650 [Bacilli bacterium]|nr:hypothetical protein [Bacilli bacterium]